MELIYLWVEEYKNIYHQGFNFSPKFKCDYNEEKKELTITENKDCVSIFPKNINVTAIVGENGSGKSSIIEILLDIYAGTHDKKPHKNYICLYYEDKLESYTNICQIKYLNNKKEIIEVSEYCYSESILSNEHNLIACHINNQFHQIKQRVSEKLYIEHSQIDDYKIKNIFIENYMDKKLDYLKISEKFFIPKKLSILFENDIFSENNLYEDSVFYEETTWKEISDKIESLSKNNFFEKLKIVKEIFDLKMTKYIKNNTNTNFVDTIFGRVGTDEYFKAKYRFNINLEENTPEKIKICTSNENRFEFKISEIDSNIKSFINKLPYVFKVDIQDNTKSFQHLSYGERQLLIQLNFILYRANQKEYLTNYGTQNIENIIIFLDEFELGLHPNWQKKAIEYLIDFLKMIDKRFHIIITSHSPFILSDLPKENVIFLEKYKKDEDKNQEEGNCKNATKDIQLETFGANIHTLLSDGFFMSDGLMGEFAKSKIEEIKKFYEIVKFLKNKNKKYKRFLKILYLFKTKEFKHIQSIAGEPFLQTIIKNYLDELEQIFYNETYIKNKRKEFLKQFEPKELEEYLESLKNAKN